MLCLKKMTKKTPAGAAGVPQTLSLFTAETGWEPMVYTSRENLLDQLRDARPVSD